MRLICATTTCDLPYQRGDRPGLVLPSVGASTDVNLSLSLALFRCPFLSPVPPRLSFPLPHRIVISRHDVNTLDARCTSRFAPAPASVQARMLEPHVPEDLTSYIVEAYVALRAQSGQDAKNGDQVSLGAAAAADKRQACAREEHSRRSVKQSCHKLVVLACRRLLLFMEKIVDRLLLPTLGPCGAASQGCAVLSALVLSC